MTDPVLHFAPNVPVTISLVDPEGTWDAELRQGSYQTTTGQSFTLLRPAVVLLNQLEPQPGEEITICRHWKGRPTDPISWTIGLSPRSEHARARGEMARGDTQEAQDLTAALEASIDRARSQKTVTEAPTLVKRPIKRAIEPQPRPFDRGTGTDGPLPQPLPTRTQKSGGIPWNIAFREVSAWVSRELAANQLQWSDAAQQDLCSTVLIAASKAGQIGMWERPE